MNPNPPQNFGAHARAAIPDDTKQEITRNLLELHALGYPRSDTEAQERIDEYFRMCIETKLCPGVESLAAALGVTRQCIYLWSIGKNCSPERTRMIQAAKAMISAFIEQALLRGSINPVAGIFLLKNWFSYKDTRSFEIEQPEDAARPALTMDQIRERLQKDIPIDDAEFREP